ncbi:SOS response-associated peptidase [Oscillatoria sp. CS-180]|uniref:SOS response-associated peptidase n=1 Tax=Oscillatoria sp. CS-180 TaxID=3021720 RepID=UPI00232D924C|nr:SOS response-associated peptidase [Oscillatoria sp. CS-180]MDB9525499.1 SOS response-associated peptidase [Oscillatoria sp. CS-180]
MCGRFAQTQSGEAIAEAFQLSAVPELVPRYNIAPSQGISVVTQSRKTGDRDHHEKKWGLIPRWSKDSKIGQKLINARSETAAEKPSFRNAFQKRRCLIVTDGFYEWQKIEGRTKQPYLIRLKSRSPFAFAGLWERWQNPQSEEEVFSCTILTTAANDAMTSIHHRMPVILAPEAYDTWLDTTFYNPGVMQDLLGPFDASAIETTPISNAVNNPRNDSASVQEPVELASALDT